MERADRWLRNLENAFLWLAVAVLVVIALQVCLEVVLRYFFSAPLLGMIQFSEIGLLYIAFLGAGWNLRRDGHVRIEVVYQLMTQQCRHYADILGALLGFIISGVLLVFGTGVTWSYYERGLYQPLALEIPYWMILIVIPLGALPLALRSLFQFIHYLRGGRRELQQP